MNEFNQNVRTLILCFVIAIMFLIPLRFVEVSNYIGSMDQATVLGATTIQDVVLPNDNVGPLLEAPYDRIDGQVKPAALENQVLGAATQSCIDNKEADREVQAYTKMLAMPLNQLQRDQVTNEMANVAKNECN